MSEKTKIIMKKCKICGMEREQLTCKGCKQAVCAEHSVRMANENICAECCTENEYRASVRESDPDAAWTLGLDEHPENYQDSCYCDTCRSYN